MRLKILKFRNDFVLAGTIITLTFSTGPYLCTYLSQDIHTEINECMNISYVFIYETFLYTSHIYRHRGLRAWVWGP